MNFELVDEQTQLVAAVEALLSRRAGPRRARAVLGRDGLDRDLIEALGAAGFLDLATEGAGPLEAVLVAEAVGRHLGCAPVVARALVAPAIFDEPLPETLAWARDTALDTVRYGGQADVVLIDEPDGGVTLARVTAHDPEIAYGYPVAAISVSETLERLDGDAAERARSWWRLALAAEAVGLMETALRMTVEYVTDRRQFGRPLGTFQALAHRLAELFVSVEGARWQARFAAYHGAETALAAAAATTACVTAEAVQREAHQLHGAIGLTTEYDLHLWTLRLQSLRLEMGGASPHARAVADARWRVGADARPTISSE
jgi:alkylation response protein AidB-like acyl-CoA dehydrogenase